MTRFIRPSSVAEAVAVGAEMGYDGKFVSGGTAVVLMIQQGLIAPTALVDLRGLADVPGWGLIEQTEAGRLRIGAGVTLTQVAQAPQIRSALPDLARAVAVVGNVRIRNAATLCGNVAEADHSSDPPSVLVNRDAQVVIVGPQGERREPVATFIRDFLTTSLAHGELITAIEVPVSAGERAVYRKFRSRSEEDRPCVGVAASMSTGPDGTLSHLAITVGASTPCPHRLDDVTRAMLGRRLDGEIERELAAACAASVSPIEDARGSSWYRQRVIEVEVARALEQLQRPDAPTAGGAG